MPSPLKYQRILAWVVGVIFIAKWIVWYYTRSLSVFSDALEGFINLIGIAFGWYSVKFATIPRDRTHPYGHGKIEFIASIVEGFLCLFAGLGLIWQSILALFHPRAIDNLDLGIYLLAVIALVQWLVGSYYFKISKKKNLITLAASTKHMKVDAYTTIILSIGLFITHQTLWWSLDAIVAIILSLFIIYNGYKIIRTGIGGIMDESDEQLLKNVIALLNQKRKKEWIDLHNFRIIKYGSILHIDAHLTLPWYWNLREVHESLLELTEIVRLEYGEQIEAFAHTDPCLPTCCNICPLDNCPHRRQDFVRRLDWTTENVLENRQHSLD